MQDLKITPKERKYVQMQFLDNQGATEKRK